MREYKFWQIWLGMLVIMSVAGIIAWGLMQILFHLPIFVRLITGFLIFSAMIAYWAYQITKI